MARTLAARLTWLLVAVTLAGLAAVALAVWIAVGTFLAHRTDDLLRSVLDRAGKALEAAALDPGLVAVELEEIRPSGVRIEVRGLRDAPTVAVGPELAIGTPAAGCHDRGSVRACAGAAAGLQVIAARDRSDELAARDELISVLLAVTAVVGLGCALVARALARRAAAPLTELAARVDAIEPGAGERVVVATDLVEIELLARRFDDLVTRFEAALDREKRFAAQASHELRTPLTVARAEVEALAGDGPRRALAALDRLCALVETLLWFARAQARFDAERMDVVNVADVAREELRAVASATLELPDEALVRGDEQLLRRAVANLVDNAVRHGDGTIAAQLTVDAGTLTLCVRNGGTPIAADRHEALFQPFVRGPGRAAGFGLGLPFARAVARAHGGDVTIGEATEGTKVVLRLPLV